MKNKRKNIIKRIIVFLIILILLGCQNGLTYAIKYTGEEFKKRPTGGGYIPPEKPPKEDSTNESDNIIRHDYVTGIGGNVNEIIEAINKQELGTKGKDSSESITSQGAKGIYVYADNGAYVRTSDNGEYYFPLKPGESINKITFQYGYLDDEYIDNTTVDNYKERQEILKYNGQDYSVVANEFTNTIELSKKGCAQVYLVLDCSESMNEDITLSDGTRKTKLQVEKNIATKIVNSLLDGNKNIYIGLVVFTGEVYRKTSLTNDKNVLINSINGNIEFNDNYYTNIKGALQKAYDSYANNIKETSNRYMFLLSDGIPTSDGESSHTLYEATTQEEINENNEKLKLITNNTKDEVEKILQEDVKLYSVFTMDNTDEFDNKLINYIFNDFDKYSENNIFKQVDTIENISTEIIQEFVKYVQEDTKIIKTGYTTNKNYRENVLGNYNSFYYDNTYYFKALDMEVTSDNLDIFKEYLRKLVEQTTVTIECPTSATGQTPITEYEETQNITNEQGEIIGTRKIYHKPNPVTFSGPVLNLQQLPEFTLNPKVAVTELSVIATNGTELDKIATSIEENKHLIITLEEAMLYGSEARVQYTIDIKNTSIYNDCENIKMLFYIPDDFQYMDSTATGIGIDGITALETKNSVVINKKNVKKFKELSDEVKKYIQKGHTAIAISVNVNTNNFQLLTNGSIQIKLNVNKLLSSRLEDMTYGADTEIFGYKNDACRRIQYKATSTNNLSSRVEGLIGAVAGDHNTTEADYATTANYGIVLPPTGDDRRVYYICFDILALIIIGCYVKHKITKK